MIRRIVIPTDGYGLEDHVIKYVANAFPFAEFDIVSVVNTHEGGIQLTTLLYNEMMENAKKAVKRGKHLLETEGIDNVRTKVLEGLPSKEIMKYAKVMNADLIALRVYNRKATASSQRMGSTVKHILERCMIPVLTLAEECNKVTIKNVLFATDGKRRSELAKDFAILLSTSLGANLEALHVVEGDNNGSHEDIFKNLEWKAALMKVEIKESLEHGDPAEKILEHAKDNDIIIMGSGKRLLFWHYVGHVTRVVCTHSTLPVIYVHGIKKRWNKRIRQK